MALGWDWHLHHFHPLHRRRRIGQSWSVSIFSRFSFAFLSPKFPPVDSRWFVLQFGFWVWSAATVICKWAETIELSRTLTCCKNKATSIIACWWLVNLNEADVKCSKTWLVSDVRPELHPQTCWRALTLAGRRIHWSTFLVLDEINAINGSSQQGQWSIRTGTFKRTIREFSSFDSGRRHSSKMLPAFTFPWWTCDRFKHKTRVLKINFWATADSF